MDREEQIYKAIEKALGLVDAETVSFKKGEAVKVKKLSLPRKEWTGKIVKVMSGSYMVSFPTFEYGKKFSKKTLESIDDKKGFKYKLEKL